jgi:hypothetical protein
VKPLADGLDIRTVAWLCAASGEYEREWNDEFAKILHVDFLSARRRGRADRGAFDEFPSPCPAICEVSEVKQCVFVAASGPEHESIQRGLGEVVIVLTGGADEALSEAVRWKRAIRARVR